MSEKQLEFLAHGADELRIQLRKMRFSLVLGLSFIVHLIFTACGFATAVGLYTLLAYTILICMLSYALNWLGADRTDLIQTASFYPMRVQTPLHVEFLPFIGSWLAWWTITELFKSALILYRDTILWQFFFFPALVVLVTWLRSSSAGIARVLGKSSVPLLILQIATIATLFFPTRSWAPQHSEPFITSARVLLFFISILLYDYLRPANTQVTKDLEHQASIVSAYENVANEHSRALEIASLNAWILVSPFIVGLLGFICTFCIFAFGTVHSFAVAAEKEEPPIYVDTRPPQIATSSAFYSKPHPPAQSPPPPQPKPMDPAPIITKSVPLTPAPPKQQHHPHQQQRKSGLKLTPLTDN